MIEAGQTEDSIQFVSPHYKGVFTISGKDTEDPQGAVDRLYEDQQKRLAAGLEVTGTLIEKNE